MTAKDLILVNQLCKNYQVEVSFFNELHEIGLIEIITVEKMLYVPEHRISDVEKIIRLHNELHINIEGIDAIFHLLNQVESLQNELTEVKNKLRLYDFE